MFLRSTVYFCAATGLAALAGSHAPGASYNEFVDPDLSDNVAAPTTLVLDPGVNSFTATSSVTDSDLIHLVVPAGRTLDSIIVAFHQDENRVFAGVQQGSTWTAGIGFDIDPSVMLGWTDFPISPGHNHIGEDILPNLAIGAGAIGFAPPLPSGDFTFLFQTYSSNIPFALNFVVSGGVPGDFNGDKFVNSSDLIPWRAAFGVTSGADADNDGDSDGRDMLIWQANFGKAPSTPGIIAPEPSAAVLSSLAWLLTARRRRKEYDNG
jgi:hypothetical protein